MVRQAAGRANKTKLAALTAAWPCPSLTLRRGQVLATGQGHQEAQKRAGLHG